VTCTKWPPSGRPGRSGREPERRDRLGMLSITCYLPPGSEGHAPGHPSQPAKRRRGPRPPAAFPVGDQSGPPSMPGDHRWSSDDVAPADARFRRSTAGSPAPTDGGRTPLLCRCQATSTRRRTARSPSNAET
jgi:hypothetical protein